MNNQNAQVGRGELQRLRQPFIRYPAQEEFIPIEIINEIIGEGPGFSIRAVAAYNDSEIPLSKFEYEQIGYGRRN